jgi:stearoyl-CoA desaturase (delta-9 desaturase)
MFKNIPFNRVEWVTSGFLITTALLTVTAVPWYFWTYGWDWFIFAVFLYFYISTGMSITVGYHRLFSHKAFQAKWPVKLYVLLFGAAAFENSAYGGVPSIANTINMSIRMMTLTTSLKDSFGHTWDG